MRFDGKVIAVTGAGSGIGEAAAKKLAGEGARVVVADVDERGGQRVVEEIAAAGGVAAFVRVDVSDPADATQMVEFAIATYGALDGAVNNAGISQPVIRLHETDTDLWQRVIDINLSGIFHTMRAEISHFLTVGGGVIVNTASGLGLKAGPFQGAYTVAKHGVVGLTRQAAIEYIGDNIRVNAVAPGLVGTPLFYKLSPDEQATFAQLQPGGRVAEPEEIANAMVFLLSEEASFISGDTVLVDAAQAQK